MMKNSKKALIAGAAATAAGLGLMAAKKHESNKSPYQKFLDKLEDYLD